MSSSNSPVRLNRKLVERPWGGEIWFTAEQELPLLIKYIYTHQALSFQVHPTDAYARDHHNRRGKTEMWYIVRATAAARLALGFREPVAGERLRAASVSGEIEHLVNWVEPHPGDAFFTPAGTVHAIGAGLELWEIQENSDITYRLFDYGRGRELHLDRAIDVTNTAASDSAPVQFPVCCEFFCTDRITLDSPFDYQPDPRRFQILIGVRGRGCLGSTAFSDGEVWLIPPAAPRFKIVPAGPVELLRTWVP